MNVNIVTIVSGVVSLLTVPSMVLAQGLQPAPIPAGTQGGPLVQSVINIINAFLVLASIVALIYLLIGGVQYITSQGDEDKAGTAKQTILYAIIGLIVIGLAAAVVNFAIDALG
ncbi:MAG: hypothetical protein ACRD4B_03460 [Acidobacteriota bacterium]